MEKAKAFELSPSAICLNMLLDAPLPRRRRQPTVNDQAMKAYIANNAKLADVLRASVAEWGKVNSNVNQIAYMLNANTAPERISNLIETAFQELIEIAALHKERLDDLKELRTMGMDALGLEH
jgi:hypothetical protein